MKLITPERVFASVQEVLNGEARAARGLVQLTTVVGS
jgi:hypothetical protein